MKVPAKPKSVRIVRRTRVGVGAIQYQVIMEPIMPPLLSSTPKNPGAMSTPNNSERDWKQLSEWCQPSVRVRHVREIAGVRRARMTGLLASRERSLFYAKSRFLVSRAEPNEKRLNLN